MESEILCSNKKRVFSKNLILSFCIAGTLENAFKEEEIIYKIVPLYYYPKTTPLNDWEKRINLVNYNNNILAKKPEFVFAVLHSKNDEDNYLYGIKYTEVNACQENNPVFLLVESSKNAPEDFKHLLLSLYECYIINRKNSQKETNYKKIEFINVLFFMYYNIINPTPHSTIEINFPFIINPLLQVSFYYSSNYELPCNKTETNIYKLFNYLDVSIIIKIIFKLLLENPVLLISQDPNLLIQLIPALSSLLFPIKWKYPLNPINPNYLKQTQNEKQYFYGYITDEGNFNKILKVAGETFVVDCDTNEIYNGEKYVQFCPLPTSQFCCQSEEVVMAYDYNKNTLYGIDLKKKVKYKLLFLISGNVLIDCDDDNRLVVELKDNYLSKEEWKELKEQIQTLKKENTFKEIEEDDNLNIQNDSDNEDDNNIQERTFDYKMKKIFTKLILSKIKGGYLYYNLIPSKVINEFQKKTIFENDSSSQIIKNVFDSEEKDNNRGYYNSLYIKFHIQPFTNNTTLNDIFKSSGFLDIYTDYLDICQILHTKKENNEIENDFGNVNDKELLYSFCYGKKGVVSILKGIEKFAKNIDDILRKMYYKQVLIPVLDQNRNQNKTEFKSISFKLGNMKSLEDSHQYHNYMALLFHELYSTNLSFNYLNQDLKKKEYILINLINTFYKGFFIDKNEFPLFTFYSILKTIPIQDLIKLKSTLLTPNELQPIFNSVQNKENIINH